MIKNVFLFALIVLNIPVAAQKIKSPAAFRLLQTANTLMEAQQLDAAEEYFKKGLSKAETYNDVYCQAYANQGLGTLYSKLDQAQVAVTYYQAAIRLYRDQHLTVIANVVETLLKSVQGIGDLYAGIEVGAKGVKLSVIDVKLSKDRQYDYTLKADTAINTDAASLSYQSEKETYDAIAVLWEIIKNRYKVPGKRVYIVISSGLKQELDKYNKTEYFANIIRPKNMDSSVSVSSVSAIQEAELSMQGIVPQKDRFTAGQIDAGSGNTKGGYFNADKKFVAITFPLGTKSFQRLVDAREQGDISRFATAAQQLWKDSISMTVEKELSDKADFKSRDNVYLSGGIVWALASFLHPGEAQNNYMVISRQDISEFNRMLLNNYDELTHPAALTAITNETDAAAAKNNIKRVMKTYDQRALIAGSILLNEMAAQVNTINPNKKFIYPKYAYVGWISGYILKKATQQYTGLATTKTVLR